MNARPGSGGITAWQFDEYVLAEADGYATPDQIAALEADPVAWRVSLGVMLREAEEHLKSARSLTGDEREQVLADLEDEVGRIEAAIERRDPRPPEPEKRRNREPGERPDRPERVEEPLTPGTTQLQVSWEPGRVVAWAGGQRAPAGSATEVAALLAAAGAPESGWTPHPPAVLSGDVNADACAIPVGDVLGWLVAAGTDQVGDDVGSSVRWLGRVAVWAVELTARARWLRSFGAAPVGARAPRTRAVRTPCGGRRRWWMRPGSNAWPRTCRAACACSIARSIAARSPGRR